MSQPGSQPHTACKLSAQQLRSELARISVAGVVCGAHTVSFQPDCRPQYRTEDRHLVEDWELDSGSWKFIGVFDGANISFRAVVPICVVLTECHLLSDGCG
jgi:hypothetical protein